MGKKRLIAGLTVAVALVGGIHWYRAMADDNDPLARHEAAMRSDAVGGKTPDATLALFVAALRADDAAAAARYFMLDDGLSRAKWEKRLSDLKVRGLLRKMADDIEKNAEPVEPSYEGDAGYELLNADGSVGAIIDMEFNGFSGVWKLQAF